jgi:hypothetical protein
MRQIDFVFNQVRDVMDTASSPLAIRLSTDEKDGPFSSAYIESHRNEWGARFIWDGKEAWLVFQNCEDVYAELIPNWRITQLQQAEADTLDEVKPKELVQEFERLIGWVAQEYRAA